MKRENKGDRDHCHHCKIPRRGGSSFFIHDRDSVFRALGLNNGDTVLDAGCGPGDYTLHASRLVGESGVVYALDKNEDLIKEIWTKADSMGLGNVRPLVADVTEKLPVNDCTINVCLLSTVLHIPDVALRVKGLGAEIRRVLKPGGRLAIIECHKGDTPFGPPKHMRMSPEEVRGLMGQWGFDVVSQSDFGYSYMIQFRVSELLGTGA